MTWLSQVSQETVLVLALGAALCAASTVEGAALAPFPRARAKGSCCLRLPLGVWIELETMPVNRKENITK